MNIPFLYTLGETFPMNDAPNATLTWTFMQSLTDENENLAAFGNTYGQVQDSSRPIYLSIDTNR